MATVAPTVAEICRQAKLASRETALLDRATKDRALRAIAVALEERNEEVLEANEQDMLTGRERGLSAALLDRLALDERRIAQIAAAVREIAALPDPVGEVIEGRRLPNGLDLRKVRVPLGVVAVVYEARPNVTIDAAALCLKSGNAIVLRGSSAAARSNAVLAEVAARAALASGLPRDCVSLLPSSSEGLAGGRYEDLSELARQSETVDLIIPRGGEGLKAALTEVATVPVIYAASGNCHVYVDASADQERAELIVVNAKVQRPGVCNAAEKLLVHRSIAERFIPRVARSLRAAGVALVADETALAILGSEAEPASQEDWSTEYLELRLAIAVVDSLGEAIEHIARYGSGHSEAIVTEDLASAQAFERGVDAACVYVNASTRFTDGGEFGMGAEIGNATQKLHARGPIGLRELCTTKYLIEGEGQIRT